MRITQSNIRYYEELINRNKKLIKLHRAYNCWNVYIMDEKGLNIEDSLHEGLSTREAWCLLKGIYFGMRKK